MTCAVIDETAGDRRRGVESDTKRNLTELEQQAIDAAINLSDGHPRQALTESQARIVDDFPRIFRSAEGANLSELERRVQRDFFSALGQRHAPISAGAVFSVYSSSVAMMAVAATLAQTGHTVALLCPTFDNIHDLLARVVPVIEITEAECEAGDISRIRTEGATALFLTSPNNPTGWVLSSADLLRLAAACKAHDIVLCMDTCFRGYDERMQYDCYEILHEVGVEYLVIEDTGKLWPMLEMKLGFVAASDGLAESLRQALSDILLSVSPFVLEVIGLLVQDARDGGFAALHGLISRNRSAIESTTENMAGVRTLDPDARVSVCRVHFPNAASADWVRLGLERVGIHVLPCPMFDWARPDRGSATLRFALARDEDQIDKALTELRKLWDSRPAELATGAEEALSR